MAGDNRTQAPGTPLRLDAALVCGLLLSLGCASHRGYRNVAEAQSACEARSDCTALTLQPGVVLDSSEECWVTVLRQRCNAEDLCILECLLAARARNVGGGCWHECGHVFVSVRGKPYQCDAGPAPGSAACK